MSDELSTLPRFQSPPPTINNTHNTQNNTNTAKNNSNSELVQDFEDDDDDNDSPRLTPFEFDRSSVINGLGQHNNNNKSGKNVLDTLFV